MARFRVRNKELPSFRFVDLYRATEDYCKNEFSVRSIDSEHAEDLNGILHAKRPQWSSRQIQRSNTTAWPVGREEEVYLPVDRFWVCTPPRQGATGGLIVRLRYNRFAETAILEVASDDASLGEECLNTILDRSVERSIYRNRVLELAFEAGTKDEYGDVEKAERLRILFKAYEPVDDSDVVIDEEVRRILWRNVADLHLRRGILKANRVPVRRGVLLYGPPGTGKTFACRYLCSKLTETTRIIVAGTALLKVSAIFSLARMLQPSLVILEDVDLVFASRDINLYSSVLGDLLDQMDGLRPYEDIGIVLTTNSIERMEAAIKDRPGRVSQCIFFGPPNPNLRKKYLAHHLRSYDASNLDLDRLVADSDGATQAFLKEWVHRSVQIACERLDDEATPVDLCNEDFRKALVEMKRFSEGSTGRIIGFHGPG
ncbi:MAG: AAA family ATPase [Kiloniellaceae bacterium]